MNELLKKLAEWIKVIQAAILGTIIIETILVIFIGIASNKINGTFNHWYGILTFCSLFYIFLLVIKTAYQLKFPSSIVEELISKKELEEKILLLDRQKAINGYIETAIQGLNKQTCSFQISDDVGHLCDQVLEVRLQELLEPVISYTDVILDTSTEKKFTIGIHLDAYQKFPNDYNQITVVENEYGTYVEDWELISDRGILILKDELYLSELFPKNLLEIERVDGATYEVQSAIKKTLNNLNFNFHNFNFQNRDYTIISSEILEVCSDEYVNGVLFIVFKKGIILPNDVSEILSIFNRITANYVSKYNSCIVAGIISKKKNPAA